MTKQDWLEVLNASSNRDWTDWLLITATILSPIVALLTAIFASKSAKAAEKAANLSLQMYEEQIREKEKQKVSDYHFEKAKLIKSLYTIPDFIREQDKKHFVGIYRNKYRLEEAYESLQSVNISVFSKKNIDYILTLQKKIKYRIDELNSDNHINYRDLIALSSLIENLFKELDKN